MLSFGWLGGALVLGLCLVLSCNTKRFPWGARTKAQRRQKTGRLLRTNTLVAAGCWLMALGIGTLGFRAKSAISDDQTTLSSFVESEATRQARANMVNFRGQAPRLDLIKKLVPWGKRNPLGMTIYLSTRWDHESNATQKHLMNTWAALWFASAKPGLTRRITPQFWLCQERGRWLRTIERLKPENLRPG